MADSLPSPENGSKDAADAACAERERERPLEGSYGEYDANGVDLSLLRYMLQLSPLERLQVMERHARDVRSLNEYGRRHRQAQAARRR